MYVYVHTVHQHIFLNSKDVARGWEGSAPLSLNVVQHAHKHNRNRVLCPVGGRCA